MREPLLPGAKALLHVPDGWRLVRLRQVASNVAGGRLGLTKSEDYRSAGYPAFSAAGCDGYVDRWEFEGAAVVVPSIGSIGRAYRASGRWTTLANTQVVFPNADLDSAFLHHRVDDTGYWPVSGTAQPFIKPRNIGDCWLALPPLSEQRKIAEILDTVDEAIRKTEAIIAKLKQVKQGLLHDLLTRGIDDNGELRDPDRHPEQFKDSPLGPIPKTWEVCPLTGCGELVTGMTPPSADPSAWGHNLPFVTPAEIDQEGHVAETERYVSEQGLRYIRSLPPNCVLVVCIGSLGKVGLALRACATNQQINALVPRDGVHPIFAAGVIRNHVRQLHRWAGLQAVPIVNKTQFGRMIVPVAPESEQRAIADRIAAIDDRLGREEQFVEKIGATKRGLMEDLLTGRVRVTDLLKEDSAA